MGRCHHVLAAALIICSAASAEFEDLSTPELEDLLQTLDYDQQYPNPEYDYEPNGPSYYDEYGQVEPEVIDQDVEDLLDFVPTQVRQPESRAHAPVVTGPLSRPLPSAAQKPQQPQQQQQQPNTSTNKSGKGGSNPNTVLPAYCDPPNPCPLGYTEKDGCLEAFENTSEFSRTYQARQNCLCDSEHMFNCPATSAAEEQGQKMAGDASSFLASLPAPGAASADGANPFLDGAKLHLAAKKGLGY